METSLGYVALVAVVFILLWGRDAFWEALWKLVTPNVLDRRGHVHGQAAIDSRSTCVVPGASAAEVVGAVLSGLGYPTVKPAIAPVMVLVVSSDTEATFAMASRLSTLWKSRLWVMDDSDGVRGKYEVVRYKLADGIVSGWKEMEIVERRIGEIVMGIGGTVKVNGRPH